MSRCPPPGSCRRRNKMLNLVGQFVDVYDFLFAARFAFELGVVETVGMVCGPFLCKGVMRVVGVRN